jgi:hypothetical protein
MRKKEVVMPAFNNYDFGKARVDEFLREAENQRLVNITKTENKTSLSLKDRVLLSSGNLLISFGWKMRRASSCPYPCPEPNRA